MHNAAVIRFFRQIFRLLIETDFTMKYKELIDRLSEKTGHPKVKTREMLEDTVQVISEHLSQGKGVSVPDLGTFGTKVITEKKVYNPHYEAFLMVPPKRTVEFNPSSKLKEEVKYLEQTDE